MADETTQRKAHAFFIEHHKTLEPFTKEDVRNVTGWSEASVNAYWSKQFKNILEPVGDKWRLRDRFSVYQDWRRFKNLVTQVKAAPSYSPTVFDDVVVYEFYMPLSHETALRVTLDSLFYRDVVMPRLRYRIGVAKLSPHFKLALTDSDDVVLENAAEFVASKFGGYSIYHVDGRFRSTGLLTQEQALQQTMVGSRYLIDETTAVTRFVFPCKSGEAEKVRFLFKELFINPITEQVSGEDEIWVVESGSQNKVHVWKPA